MSSRLTRSRWPARERTVWRAALALAVVLSVAAVTGCTAIPRSGDVQVGLTGEQPTPEAVIFSPRGPIPGDSPEEIVRGFTNATSSAASDYEIARSFLTPDFSKAWNPNAGVVIDDTARSAVESSQGVVELDVVPVARVDERGILTLAPPAPAETLSFGLEQVEGEWRIRSAPDGILLDRATFSIVFGQHNLFFTEPRGNTLVPDPRWFAVGATTATDVVTELIAGPSPQLQGGVVATSFPEGTALATDSVPIVSGEARIDFTPEIASADDDALQAMQKQVSASLQSVTGVSSVAFMVNQSPFATAEITRGSASTYPIVSSRPVIQLGAELGELNDVTLISIGVWTRPIVAADPIDLIIRNGNDAAVMRTATGVSWVDDQARVTLLDGRANLASPTLDRADWVWTAVTTDPSQVRVTNPQGEQRTLATPWSDADTISALRISRDGTRLAAMVTSGNPQTEGDQVTVRIAGVIRDESGTPTGLTSAQTVATLPVGNSGVDLDWMTETQLIVAEQPDSGRVQMISAGLSLFTQDLGSSPGITSVTGANNRSELRALSSAGILRAPQGVSWRQLVNNITLLAKHG